MNCSCCINTYKRPNLLKKLLKSLAEQNLAEETKLEIIVVDNGPHQLGKNIVNEFQKRYNIPIYYFVQPEKNISLTRNEGVKNASGEFICFIDDDEIVSNKWIISLFNSLVKYNADGAFGYTEPVFDENIPEYLQHREFYFSPVGKTGTIARFYFTTNTIVKTDLIKSEVIPFEPGYGLTGGSDVHLFGRLKKKGAKFIDCREALAYEFIPNERGTKRYVFNRALRGGQAFVRRRLEQNNNISSQLKILFITIIVSFYSSVLYLFKFSSTYGKIKNLQNLGASIGKIRGLFAKYKSIY